MTRDINGDFLIRHFEGSPMKRRTNKRAAATPRKREARFETLEDRALLSVTNFWLDECEQLYAVEAFEDDAIVIESATAGDDVPTVDLSRFAAFAADSSEVVCDAAAEDDSYDIVYDLQESGRVRMLGQNGLQYLSTYKYCALPDPIYQQLWEEALANWTLTLTEDLPDVSYPYLIDGERVEIDDLYLYFGFSDSYTSSTTLGSSINGGYCRDSGRGLPAAGSLVFNSKYFTANPSSTVRQIFYNTALHEVAHALGYNLTYFRRLNLVEETSAAPYGLTDLLDGSTFCYYVGENGVNEYYSLYPDELTSTGRADAFPMETYTASGSYGTHPSSILATYYFNYAQRDGLNYALSASYTATITSLTLAVFQDLGYSVDYDFADPLDSPAPISVQADVCEDGVTISWERAKGVTSAAGVTYTVQRCVYDEAQTQEERVWIDVATGLSDLEYFDADPGSGVFLYRVVANNATTNVDLGLYRAKQGDTISWSKTGMKSGTKYYVYALTNAGSNKVSWTTAASALTTNSWTVKKLDKAPYDGTTFYRVVAQSSVLDVTGPSKAVRVEFNDPDPAALVPEGVSALLKAAESETPGRTYWWNVGGPDSDEYYVQGGAEFWYSPSDDGYGVGERVVVRSKVKNAAGETTSTQKFALEVERVQPTILVETDSTFSEYALFLSTTSQSGRGIVSWTIDWGDGKTDAYERLGYSLTAAHFYDEDLSATYAISLTTVDCDGNVDSFESITTHQVNVQRTRQVYFAELGTDPQAALALFGDPACDEI